MDPVAHLGIVGLGLVGRALAARTVALGMTVSGYDVAPQALAAARDQGVATVGDLRSLVADSDALLVAVFDGTQLREVVEQALAQPLVEQLAPEHVHVGGPGAGVRAKLATNLVLGLNRIALAEGLLFAETLG